MMPFSAACYVLCCESCLVWSTPTALWQVSLIPNTVVINVFAAQINVNTGIQMGLEMVWYTWTVSGFWVIFLTIKVFIFGTLSLKCSGLWRRVPLLKPKWQPDRLFNFILLLTFALDIPCPTRTSSCIHSAKLSRTWWSVHILTMKFRFNSILVWKLLTVFIIIIRMASEQISIVYNIEWW